MKRITKEEFMKLKKGDLVCWKIKKTTRSQKEGSVLTQVMQILDIKGDIISSKTLSITTNKGKLEPGEKEDSCIDNWNFPEYTLYLLNEMEVAAIML